VSGTGNRAPPEEIRSYFRHLITNAFAGAENSPIKTMKRMAHGYRDTASFRLRTLAAQPGLEVTFPHLLT
jgi:transposase